jgi:hypothetical protein
VQVDRGGGGLDRREAVVVVDGVEELQVQDFADTGDGVGVEARRDAVERIGVSVGPAVGAGNDGDAVGAERVQLADLAVDADRFEIAVAGDEQEADELFDQVGARRGRVRREQQAGERVVLDVAVALVDDQRDGADGLRDHAHAAIDDGVLHEAFTRESGVVARRVHGMTRAVDGDERARAVGFALARRQTSERVERDRASARKRIAQWRWDRSRHEENS